MDNFKIINTEVNRFVSQDYEQNDIDILNPFKINKEFGGVNDVVEFHLISNSGTILESNYNFTQYTTGNNKNNSEFFTDLILDPEQNIVDLGYDKGKFNLVYNFHRLLFNSTNSNRFFIKEISRDRTELKITSNNIEFLELQSLYIEYIANRTENNFYSDFALNFGENNQIIGVNIALDNVNTDTPSLYIKLYEPLPNTYQLKSTLWVADIISDQYSFTVNREFTTTTNNDGILLKGPNFDIDINESVSTSTPYLNITNILGNTSASLLNRLEGELQDAVKINIDYSNFENFIHFSSAQSRIENFIFKLSQIERLESDLAGLNGITNTGSIGQSILNIENQINILVQGFDGYERNLYYKSGSTTYPKIGAFPFTNLPTTATASLQWLGSTDSNSQYYGGILLDAENYDIENRDYLWNNLPEYIKEDSQNSQLEVLTSMLGQHFDYIWTYIKDISNKNVNDNRIDFGISKDLVGETLKSFGIKLYTNSRNQDNIFLSTFGINPDGTFIPTTGSLDIKTYISASDYTIPANDIVKENYKRIYHNLPYLLKSKGTRKGLRVLLSSFGLSNEILRIKEFGGTIKDETSVDQITNKFNYSINSNNVTIPFYYSNQQFISTSIDDIKPDSIEFRFKSDGNVTPPNNFQILLESSLMDINISHDDGEMGSVGFTMVSPDFQDAAFSEPISVPIFNQGWWNILLRRATGSLSSNSSSLDNTYELLISNKDEYGINYFLSSSIFVDGTTSSSLNDTWNTVDEFILGSQGAPSFGDYQEFRYWINPVSNDDFKNHTLNPKSYSYLNETGSYNNLIFRLPLGSELDNDISETLTSVHPNNIPSFIDNGVTSSIATVDTASVIYSENFEDYLINNTDGYINIESNQKVKIESDNILFDNTLSPSVSIVRKPTTQPSLNSSKLEVGISATDSINDDIIKQLGNFSLDEYIGDASNYSTEYPDLIALNKEYFQKYSSKSDLIDIIKLLSYLDNSLLKMIKDFVPAKANNINGFVVKPNLLERNKVQKFEPTFSDEYSEGVIDTAFITGSAAFDTIINTAASRSFHTTKGIIEIYKDDNAESFNADYDGSEVTVYELPEGNVVKQRNSIVSDDADIIKNYSQSAINPLENNITKSLKAPYYFLADYSSNINIPSNAQLILDAFLLRESNPIIEAQLQESNYHLKRHTIPRYEGSKTTSAKLNVYTDGDISYGKEPNIEYKQIKFGYFNEITDEPLSFPGRSNINIKYLIDGEGNITNLSPQNNNLFDIQSIFNSNTVDILLDNNQEPSNQKKLDGVKGIFAGGFEFTPILQNLSVNTSVHNRVTYELQEELIQSNNDNNQITSSLGPTDINISNILLASPATVSPNYNQLTTLISVSINSKINIQATRNTAAQDELIQKITGNIVVEIPISGPTDLISKIYQETNYGGREGLVPPGQYRDLRVGNYTEFQDRIKSFKLPSGVSAQFFRNENFGSNASPVYTGPTNVSNFSLSNGAPTSMEFIQLNTSGSVSNLLSRNDFGTLPIYNIADGSSFGIPSENGVILRITFPVEGLLVIPFGNPGGTFTLRTLNNLEGDIRNISRVARVGNSLVQITTAPSINTLNLNKNGRPYYFTQPPTSLYLSNVYDNGFNSGSIPIQNYYFKRVSENGKYNLLECSLDLSDIFYNLIDTNENNITQVDPILSTSGYQDIGSIFDVKVGDLIKFYNINSKLFPINFENQIRGIIKPQNQPSISNSDRLLIELTKEIPNEACLDFPVSGSFASEIQNIIFMSRIPNETNIISIGSKNIGKTSPGIVLPGNLPNELKEKAGNIIKRLRNQNLI